MPPGIRQPIQPTAHPIVCSYCGSTITGSRCQRCAAALALPKPRRTAANAAPQHFQG